MLTAATRFSAAPGAECGARDAGAGIIARGRSDVRRHGGIRWPIDRRGACRQTFGAGGAIERVKIRTRPWISIALPASRNRIIGRPTRYVSFEPSFRFPRGICSLTLVYQGRIKAPKNFALRSFWTPRQIPKLAGEKAKKFCPFSVTFHGQFPKIRYVEDLITCTQDSQRGNDQISTPPTSG